jgi:hypothetical protein
MFFYLLNKASKMRISALKTAMMAAIFFSSAVHAVSISRLGDGSSGTSETRATGINNANQVAGYSSATSTGLISNHALIWLDGSNAIAEFAPFAGILPTNYARFNAINGAGQVVGTSNQLADARNSPFGKQRATVWGTNGTPQQGGWQGLLAPVLTNGAYAGFPEEWLGLSDALAVNNAGVVVGYRTFKEGVDNRPRGTAWLFRTISTDSTPKWYMYMDGGQYADDEGKPLRDSTFNGISDVGLIVGWVRMGGFYETAPKKPWTWTSVGYGNLQVGSELSCDSIGGTANAVNTAGTVVGSSYVDEGTGTNKTRKTSAVYWSSATASCIAFPTLGGTYSNATATQKGGHTVGSATTPAGQKHAVLYYRQANGYGILDLSTYLGLGAAAGFSYLEEATGINDSGNIVGYGMQPNGKRAAFKIMGLFGAASAASATSSAVMMDELGDSPAKMQSIGEEVSVQSSSLTIELYNIEPLELNPKFKQHKH